MGPERIGARHPNFRFEHVDVYNQHYNPQGQLDAAEFTFPYPDASFDFVFLVSVFTHLLPQDMRNYLREVARVLRPGATCFITYTLLNSDTLTAIAEGKSKLHYVHEMGGFRTTEPNEPETSVAYYEDDLRSLYGANGLEIQDPIHYGSWSGRPGNSHQDIVIARKSPLN